MLFSKNNNLIVHEKLPDGFIERFSWETFGVVRIAENGKGEKYYFCHYRYEGCNGWIKGEPYEQEENSISPRHPLSGRCGTSYHCRRCGGEIGFYGMVS